jgi:hypothetical protein
LALYNERLKRALFFLARADVLATPFAYFERSSTQVPYAFPGTAVALDKVAGMAKIVIARTATNRLTFFLTFIRTTSI